MSLKDNRHSDRLGGASAFVLLGLLILLVYSNTFDASWHLDDYNSIIGNQSIHAVASQPESIFKPFLGSGPLNRPVAFFTFAMNWYWGGDDPVGYHLVNILIHLLCAFFLYRTLMVLFETPKLNGILDPARIQFVSLLAAVLWALNPIQVQSVTYIVQRMASLCGMFYILGIYFYIHARLSERQKRRFLRFGLSAIFFVLGFLTKENAATLPLSLMLIEGIFFLDLGDKAIRRKIIGLVAVCGLMLAAAGLLLFYNSDVSDLFTDYDKRYFSLYERILTQPRVLLLYISLIFYPTPSRLSLVHDIQLSTSLLTPWTTLPSIAVLLALIACALFKLRKWPIVSFAILFFFLTHSIESSVIPLELVFEHRNYLPSMFIFWPIALGLERLLYVYAHKSRLIYRALFIFMPLFIVGLGTGTYIRNFVWSSEKTLWEDSLRKAPGSARPYINLAWAYYERKGEPQKALVFYHEALKKKHNSNSQYAKIYNNIANIYYQNGDCDRAAQYWRKSHEISDRFYTPRYRRALALTRCGRVDEALVDIDHVVAQQPDFVKALSLKGVILLLQNQPRLALFQFRRCIQLEPDVAYHYLNLGAGLCLMGEHQRAALFLKKALSESKRDRIALLWSVINYTHMGDARKADILLDELATELPPKELSLWLRMGFKARVYKSDIIFPAADQALLSRLMEHYKQSLPLLEKLSGAQPLGEPL